MFLLHVIAWSMQPRPYHCEYLFQLESFNTIMQCMLVL